MNAALSIGMASLAILMAGTAVAQEMPDAAAETLYKQRFDHLFNAPGGAGADSYDILEPVAGARRWTPLPRGTSVPPAALAAARDYARANRSSAFMVWHRGKLVEQSFFGETGDATPVVSKSLAKPLSVIAVGRALMLGKIKSLDQPMADYITEWRGTPKAAITIRQVLGMRSGLLPQAMSTDPANILNRAYLHPYHDRIIIRDYPLTDVPGSSYEYSNANGELVAPLIERATGVPYQQWISREVLAPIGARGGQIWMNRPGGTPHSGCCILLPADSYLRLGILLARGGRWNGRQLVSPSFVKAMTTGSPQYPQAGLGVYLGSPYVERRGPANPRVEFGKTLHSEPYLADDLFLFDGNSNQVVYVVPSKQLVILRTGNTPPRQPEWDNSVLPNLLLRSLR
ncbi:serine hydrolase domain-containing protein [Sphingomonas sp. HF-S3]|uniref:Serine hydrolase domain-containing protein n=1 Tax=Sphingomonas rustica TaxID=3103142 RepID=A0ABV0B2L0_9SPHN